MNRKTLALIVTIGLLIAPAACSPTEPPESELRVGVIAPITGDIPGVGLSTVNAAQLATQQINDAGGLEVGGQRMKVVLFIEDDKDQAQAAASAAQKLINQSNVAVIIGPQASRNAIPASTICEEASIPMISPWSTNPETTAGKRYVFRVAFIDPFQGRIMAKFAMEELRVTKAAVLYDVASAYNKGIADIFKQVFEEAGGTVVAFESYTTGEEDFTAQLTAIRDSEAEVLFLPNYYNEVPLQVQQALEIGVTCPIIGSDSWGGLESADLAQMEGFYFSTHYSTDIAGGMAQDFIKKYQEAYDEIPDDVAALTYDAFGLLFQVIKSKGAVDPESIRNGLSSVERYEGVTGAMEYKGTGDPVKSAVIIQIKGGKFVFYRQANP